MRGERLAVRFAAAATVLSLIVVAGDVTAQEPSNAHLPPKPQPRELRHEGVVIKITSLLIEPVAGFLIGRGFTTPVAQRYAASCVIRVVISNESAPSNIGYDLRAWRARRADGALVALHTREDWMTQWRAAALPAASLIGFEWSQLPTQQVLDIGDSTNGMVNTGLPPASRFDLLFEWMAEGKTYRIDMKGIDCAPPS